MSSQPLNGRITSKNAGSGAVFTALVAFSLLAISAGSVWAQSIAEAQADINTALSNANTHRVITNATAAELGTAVATAMQNDADTTLTPTIFAEAAISPVSSATAPSATQKADAPTVVLDLINKLITDGTNSPASAGSIPFANDVADVTDGVVSLGGATASLALTLATKEAVVKDALLAISDGPADSSTAPLAAATILSADKAIGAALTADAYLESSSFIVSARNSDGLVALLEASIASVDGSRGTSAIVIPEAAQQFVEGIVSTGVTPDNILPDEFAIDIMAPLAKNFNADELVANALGGGTVYSGTNLTTLADTLFKTFPAAVTKITQGLTADVSQSTGEVTRTDFITNALAGTSVKYAPAILEGAVYTDPYFSAVFAGSVMTDIYETTSTNARTGDVSAIGKPTLVADAPAIALNVGEILGQDGAELTLVSSTFASFIESGKLSAASAGVYASDLITGAVKGEPAAANDFAYVGLSPDGVATADGGTLAIGTLLPRTTVRTGITTQTEDDLQSIADSFTAAIISGTTLSGTTAQQLKQAETIAAYVGAVALDIAKEVGIEKDGSSNYVAALLASSVADTIKGFSADLSTEFTIPHVASPESEETLILNDVQTDLDAIDKRLSAYTTAIGNGVASTTGELYVNTPGETANATITVVETPITNL